MGFFTDAASTNDPTRRVDAVVKSRTRILGNGKIGFQIDNRCNTLIQGFQGGYCLERKRVTGAGGVYRDKPDKGKFSHAHDALQYLLLGFYGNLEVEDDSDYTHDMPKSVSTLGY